MTYITPYFYVIHNTFASTQMEIVVNAFTGHLLISNATVAPIKTNLSIKLDPAEKFEIIKKKQNRIPQKKILRSIQFAEEKRLSRGMQRR